MRKCKVCSDSTEETQLPAVIAQGDMSELTTHEPES
jgi:hypothetical protein